jgi:hypothetical protein
VKKQEPDCLIDTVSEQTDKRIQRGETEPCFFSPDATLTDFYRQLFENAVEAISNSRSGGRRRWGSGEEPATGMQSKQAGVLASGASGKARLK